MDQSMLKNSDALIMTGITEAPTANPDAMLGEFCTHLGMYSKSDRVIRELWYVDFSNLQGK